MDGSRNLGLIVLGVLLVVLSLSLIAYVLIKLYIDHRETQTLTAQEEKKETGGALPEHSLPPPMVAHVFPNDKQLGEAYRTSVPDQQGVLRPSMPAAKPSYITVVLHRHHQPSTYHQPSQHHHHHHHDSPPPLFLRSGSEIGSQQQSVPAPPACTLSPPRGLGEAADKPHMVGGDRRPLAPLSAVELERRRNAWKSKAPTSRTLGKENVAPIIDGVGLTHGTT